MGLGTMLGVLLIGPNGETISSIGLERFNAVSSTLGSVVSAVEVFARKVSGKDLSELQFGQTRLFTHRLRECLLVTLHPAADTAAEEVSRRVLSIVGDLPDRSLGKEALAEIGRLLDDEGH